MAIIHNALGVIEIYDGLNSPRKERIFLDLVQFINGSRENRKAKTINWVLQTYDLKGNEKQNNAIDCAMMVIAYAKAFCQESRDGFGALKVTNYPGSLRERVFLAKKLLDVPNDSCL